MVLWNRGTHSGSGTTEKDRAALPITDPERPTDTANSPLRIAAFDVEHTALTPDGKNIEPRGRFGDKTFTARQNDYVKLRLTLSRPGYAYLVAFRPDGVIDLCYPNDKWTKPPLGENAAYPFTPEDVRKGVRYQLAEGPGLWSFAAIVSEHELPPFAEWKQKHSFPSMKGQPGVGGAVLIDNGQVVDEQTELGLSSSPAARGRFRPAAVTSPRLATP